MRGGGLGQVTGRARASACVAWGPTSGRAYARGMVVVVAVMVAVMLLLLMMMMLLIDAAAAVLLMLLLSPPLRLELGALNIT